MGEKLCSLLRLLGTLHSEGPILSNFLVKVSVSPMTGMVLVFLVCAKCNCQKLVKLS